MLRDRLRSTRRVGQLPQLLLQQIEIDRLGEELGGAAFARHPAALIVAIGGHHHDRQIGAALLDLGQQLSPSMPGMLMSDRITISVGSIPSASFSNASSPEAAKCIA